MKTILKRMLAVLTGAVTASGMATALGTGIASARTDSENSAVSESTAPEGEVIVMYHGTSEMKSSTLSRSLGSTVAVSESYVFDVPEGISSSRSLVQNQPVLQKADSSDFTVSLVKSEVLSTSELMTLLKSDSSVMYVSPNYQIETTSYSKDTYSDYQWGLENTGQNGGTPGLDINADTEALTPSADVGEQVVAVVDTGVDYTHPDLAERMWNNPYAGTGKLNGIHGYDFVNTDDDPMDDNGHGSHCAGIIAAQANNETGISGVATGDSIRLMALKFLDSEGLGYGIEEFACYHYIYQAQLLGVNVVAINNSWGGGIEGNSSEAEAFFSMFRTMINLVGEMGAVSVCAAGNESADNDLFYTYPCNIDSPYVVSVAASNEKDELAHFSNFGMESVDIAAPGTNILSTVSYNSMNAAFYTEEQKERLLYWYAPFDGQTLKPSEASAANPESGDDTALRYSIEVPDDGASVTVETASDVYFGKPSENAASLKFTVENAVAGSRYSLRLPYYGQGGTKNTVLSFDILRYTELNMGAISAEENNYLLVSDGTVSEDGRYRVESSNSLITAGMDVKQNAWDSVQVVLSPHDKNQLCAISIDFVCTYSGNYTLYLDDLAMSRLDAPMDELLQPYDFYNGTSMATPMVTGAAAAIAAAYSNLSIKERTALLLGCTRPSSNLKGKVRTGGILDLSKLDDPNPYMLDSFIDTENNTLCIEGSQLLKMQYQINDAPAAVLEQSDTEIILDISDFVNQELKLTVQYGESTRTEFYYCSAANRPEMSYFDSSEDSFYMNGGNLLTAGSKVYYCTADGGVYQTTPTADSANWTLLSSAIDIMIFATDIFNGIEPSYMFSHFVSDGTDIYTVANLDYGFMQRSVLLKFSLETWEWIVVCDLPDAYAMIIVPVIGIYDNQLIVMGGYCADNTLSTACMAFSLEEQTWTELPALPAGVYGGAAEQIGDKLYVTMQYGEEGILDTVWSYDGTTWNDTAAELPSLAQNVLHPENASVSVYENALVYAGVPADGTGDIFTLDPEAGAVNGLDYTITGTALGKFCTSTVNGDVLYVLYQTGEDVVLELVPLSDSPVIPTVLRGDVTQDGVINGDDAYQVLYYYACYSVGMEDVTFTDNTDPILEQEVWNAADVNQDGEITADDGYWILLYYASVSVGRDVTWEEILTVG